MRWAACGCLRVHPARSPFALLTSTRHVFVSEACRPFIGVRAAGSQLAPFPAPHWSRGRTRHARARHVSCQPPGLLPRTILGMHSHQQTSQLCAPHSTLQGPASLAAPRADSRRLALHTAPCTLAGPPAGLWQERWPAGRPAPRFHSSPCQRLLVVGGPLTSPICRKAITRPMPHTWAAARTGSAWPPGLQAPRRPHPLHLASCLRARRRAALCRRVQRAPALGLPPIQATICILSPSQHRPRLSNTANFQSSVLEVKAATRPH
ncbi:MAG: hypothetical protein J3K34DRAFT_409399 [Monoraphidium minutum]|nr:MAG: hypothetical protein J3K34DRAFT_409399 [Monoraphidium minutum]